MQNFKISGLLSTSVVHLLWNVALVEVYGENLASPGYAVGKGGPQAPPDSMSGSLGPHFLNCSSGTKSEKRCGCWPGFYRIGLKLINMGCSKQTEQYEKRQEGESEQVVFGREKKMKYGLKMSKFTWSSSYGWT